MERKVVDAGPVPAFLTSEEWREIVQERDSIPAPRNGHVQAPCPAPKPTGAGAPWYYQYVSVYAHVILCTVLAVAAFILVFVLAGSCLSIYFAQGEARQIAAGASLLWVLFTVFWLVLTTSGMFLYVCFLLISVDVGRNVREMRRLLELQVRN
jgi:hypothetical protein